jgi:hydroxyethylthiazole kinase-like uncharacterized protein yjeF
MIPVLCPEEMASVDRAAPEPVEILIERAGFAVARTARMMLGGLYGARIAVIAGRGNNGADGRVAARLLAGGGARVEIVEPDVSDVPRVDLVIDAAFGTGLSREYTAPRLDGSPMVLAVDVPSGISGATGQRLGAPLKADCTVTFGALKPGHVLGDGPEWCGVLELASIGLDVSAATMELMEISDFDDLVPQRERDTHKWRSAVLALAGSTAMPGAGRLVCRAALRSGAGYVARVGIDGGIDHGLCDECVQLTDVPDPVTLRRFSAAVVGPGLGLDDSTSENVRDLCARLAMPLVVDADALHHVSDSPGSVTMRSQSTVLTPHAGEFSTLHDEFDDPVAAVRSVAATFDAVVLLKGPTTVIGEPSGRVRFVDSGDQRLATAGTGDVLSGIIVALLARGIEAFDAATGAAIVHGLSGLMGPAEGLIASDVADGLPAAFDEARRVAAATR